MAACTPATGHANQRIEVVAPTAASTTATLTLWSRSGRCWRLAGGPWPARVGRSGLSAHHREGDGTTPLGSFRIGGTVYGVAPDPGTRLAYHRLVCGDWWDEDPRSPDYNRFVHVRCGRAPPFGGGSEALWRERTAYVHFAVVDYNAARVPGRGSGIFLHADTGSATNGCVSVALAHLDRILRWLRPAARIVVSLS
ncbi:MAG TPA: L,D-transpeptidase family protein [Gaiellaceae bacterium]|nr:L,D-transpeptidase family protein [Gaiellaceae bacterium]